MKTVKVAILGLGTVGSGVYKLIQKRADVMEKTIGAQMEVKKILVRNINKKREGVDASLFDRVIGTILLKMMRFRS